MSKWLNQYTCPGFVMCPRKPWPFGNEWHTIACVLTTIIFWVELVEGKDRPKELGEKKYNDINGLKQKTVGLLLRMTESVWHSSRLLVLDSGFWWCHKGTLQGCANWDTRSLAWHIGWCALSCVLSKRRRLCDDDDVCVRNFNYTEVFHNHFNGRHAVDDNNKKRMQPIVLEDTWATKNWEDRVFAFFMGLSACDSPNRSEGVELCVFPWDNSMLGMLCYPSISFGTTAASWSLIRLLDILEISGLVRGTLGGDNLKLYIYMFISICSPWNAL